MKHTAWWQACGYRRRAAVLSSFFISNRAEFEGRVSVLEWLLWRSVETRTRPTCMEADHVDNVQIIVPAWLV